MFKLRKRRPMGPHCPKCKGRKRTVALVLSSTGRTWYCPSPGCDWDRPAVHHG